MNAHLQKGYARRLGLPTGALRPRSPDALRALVAAHVARIPFSNLHIHGGQIAATAGDLILERLVTARGGGICYELNGALGLLLSATGLPTHYLAAAVEIPAGEGDPVAVGPPLGHMACAVQLGGKWWLADAGFGGCGIVRSLPADGERVVAASGAAYRIDGRPRPLSDFVAMAWWHSTSPGSRFLGSLVVSLTAATGTSTLSGSGDPLRFTLRRSGAAHELDRAAAERALRAHFGLDTPLPTSLVVYRPTPSGRQSVGKGVPT